jgi:hypothetical protein
MRLILQLPRPGSGPLTLMIVTVMISETFGNLQHSTWLIPESLLDINSSAVRLRAVFFLIICSLLTVAISRRSVFIQKLTWKEINTLQIWKLLPRNWNQGEISTLLPCSYLCLTDFKTETVRVYIMDGRYISLQPKYRYVYAYIHIYI